MYLLIMIAVPVHIARDRNQGLHHIQHTDSYLTQNPEEKADYKVELRALQIEQVTRLSNCTIYMNLQAMQKFPTGSLFSKHRTKSKLRPCSAIKLQDIRKPSASLPSR